MLTGADPDQSVFGHPPVALAQSDTTLAGEIHELDQGPVHQAGIGGISHSLGLDRDVDGDPLEILRGEHATMMRHGEAFLQQGGLMFLAQPLTSARQGGAIILRQAQDEVADYGGTPPRRRRAARKGCRESGRIVPCQTGSPWA
jgi:hypothetical protein